MGDSWAVVVQTVKELGELSLAADHPRGRLLCQDISDSPSHGLPRCPSKTVVAAGCTNPMRRPYRQVALSITLSTPLFLRRR
jgi:hypothetical protein